MCVGNTSRLTEIIKGISRYEDNDDDNFLIYAPSESK